MDAKIFLNYRRKDGAWADRLQDRLTQHFPPGSVFLDINGDIPPGHPFAAWLDRQVAGCDLMLVLIGHEWAAEFQARAAADQRDYVRLEIESALGKIPVVPVFLDNLPAPPPASLPASIHRLLDLEGRKLRRDAFEADVKKLIDGIEQSIRVARSEAVETLRQATPTLPPNSKGRIKADATIFQGAPDGWFAPGAGETEWFKDFNDGPEMVVVPEGSFIMGSPPDEANRFDNEGPQHEVIIAKPFAVGRYTVSFEEWDTFADKSGYWPKPDDCGWGRGPQPVIGVNWDDAKAYVEWLKKESGKDYRLLSEAEWEYVCRAGSTGPFWCGPSISTEQANYRGDWTYRDGPVGIFREKTMPVNSFKPNPWGLYQVHGNVLEWVEDCWHESYSAPADGSPWMAKRGDIHVCRGGSWNYGPDWIRAACREGRYKRTNKVGLRVARTLEV